jgi:hypothetical protein
MRGVLARIGGRVDHLATIVGAGKTEFPSLKCQEREFRARITSFRGFDRLSRDELHRREA